MKALLEPNTCEQCRAPARLVRVPRPWQYFAGIGVVLAGTVFLILPQVARGIPWGPFVATLPVRIAWLLGFLVIGFYLSNWAVRVMKGEALQVGRQLDVEAKA